MFFLIDLMTAGVWSQLETSESPELQRLAAATRATVVSSRADSTTKKYMEGVGQGA